MEEIAVEGMGTMGPDAGGIMALIAGAGIVGTIIYGAICVVMIIALWKLLAKAGQPGWSQFIPIYNVIAMLNVAGKPWWWIFILWLIIPGIIATHCISKNFGRGVGTTLGLLFLGPIFLLILGFGGAEYVGGGEAEAAVE
jgi:hypothetical protein